jgi:DnaJ-domain-containing protein 1
MTSVSSASPAATSTPPPATWPYVYGIVRSDDPLIFEVPGVCGAPEVSTVVEGGLAALTSPVARPSLHGLERAAIVHELAAHQRVLEAAQEEFTVLPVKFGAILPDAGRLLAMLRSGGPAIERALRALDGKRQFEVVVLWDLAQVFELIAADPQVAALKAAIAAAPPAESVEDRVRLGRLVHEALQQRRAELSRDVTAQLRDLADDVVVNPLLGDAMVANIALLVEDDRRAELDARLDALDARYDGRLQIRCVGPLPAYSFATLEVQAPPFAAVAAARQTLGLPAETSQAALKRAFRGLAAQHHPDRNPDDPTAGATMDGITAAYRLLAAVAMAQAPEWAADDWPCRLDQEAVEQTVLLAVARQEPAEPEGAR